MSTRDPEKTWVFALVASAVLACAVVAWHLVVLGPFGWHFTRRDFWQGGLEAVLLVAALARIQLMPDARWRAGLGIAVAALYLRRHAVDLPWLVDALYLEITIALGVLALRAGGVGKPRETEGYLRAFVAGLLAWSLCAWTASALDAGTTQDLRLLTLALALVALPLARVRPLTVHLAVEWNALAPRHRAVAAALAGWFLVLFARTNRVVGYDPLWYGLRGEYVLTGETSAYHSLGLVSPVHYFPKLYELYLQPVSGLGDFSVISGMTIAIAGLLGLAAVRLLARCGVDDPRARLATAAVCLTLPAVANPSLDPKPDVLACLLVVLAALAAVDFLRTRRWPAFAWMLACGLVATQAKLTAIPFVGLLVATTLLHAAWRRAAAAADDYGVRSSTIVLALAVAITGFVTARTLLLTGVPTIGPDPLFKLWLALGFTLREPATTLQWAFPQDWADLPALVVDWLFRPERMEHIAIGWTGNVWLWLPLAALALGARFGTRTRLPATARTPVAALALAGATVALGWGYLSRGGDGNYFIAALVPAIVAGVAWTWPRVVHSAALTRALLCSLGVFALFQGMLAFASAAWTPGTRRLDLDFLRSPRDVPLENAKLFQRAGIAAIAGRLAAQPGAPRVAGCVDLPTGARLPARYEELKVISYSSPYAANADALTDYLRRFDIPFLILRRPTAATDAPRGATQADAFAAPGGLCAPDAPAPAGLQLVVEDEAWRLYQLATPTKDPVP